MLGNTGPAHNLKSAMSAIVPYVARRYMTRGVIKPYNAAASKIQMAFRRSRFNNRAFQRRVASSFITNRWVRSAAARTIQRGFRKFKFRPRGDGATTRANDDLFNLSIQIGNVRIDPIVIVSRNSEAPNTRRNNTVFLSGIKYCYHFNVAQTASEATNQNLDVHFAMIQLKGGLPTEGAWNNANMVTLIQNNFFRERVENTTDQDVRVRPFNNYVAGSTYDFGKSCLSLAPDKFNVLFHKKFPLYARDALTKLPLGGRPYMKRVEGYYKIKKRINFYNNVDNFGTHPFVMLIWCNALTRDGHLNPFALYTALNVDARLQIYFHDL